MNNHSVPIEATRESMRQADRLCSVGWMTLGVAPIPRTTAQTLRYHIGHGLVMGYPVRHVLAWSWTHRHSFRSTR